jgi:hypothetical protein
MGASMVIVEVLSSLMGTGYRQVTPLPQNNPGALALAA